MGKKLIYLVIIVYMLAFSGITWAKLFNPAVENPSFEATDLMSGTPWVNYCENWIISSENSAYLENGSYNMPAADGFNTLKMWTAVYVWQQIGTWDANVDYEVSMFVGRDDSGSALEVGLWAGGNRARSRARSRARDELGAG